MINIKTLSKAKEKRFKILTELSIKGKLNDKEEIEYQKLGIEKNLNDLETIEFVDEALLKKK